MADREHRRPASSYVRKWRTAAGSEQAKWARLGLVAATSANGSFLGCSPLKQSFRLRPASAFAIDRARCQLWVNCRPSSPGAERLLRWRERSSTSDPERARGRLSGLRYLSVLILPSSSQPACYSTAPVCHDTPCETTAKQLLHPTFGIGVGWIEHLRLKLATCWRASEGIPDNGLGTN
jgi:hypothetical protein